MRINTEKFGTIDISDDKIITFDNGIIGFQDYKKYTLIYDCRLRGKIRFSNDVAAVNG